MWGQGEVTAVIEPRKIDVLFSDRLRRLIHSRLDTEEVARKTAVAAARERT
jgi:hypothetical protein